MQGFHTSAVIEEKTFKYIINMKVRFYHWYNALLTTLLTVLGYGCSSESPVEYGVPTVDYQVKGQVTHDAGMPIPGVRVKVHHDYFDGREGQSVLTDENGNFALDEFKALPNGELIVEDVDGEANGGEFLSDTIKIWDLPKKQVEKGSGWYEGKYEVTANIRLKKKE